MSPRRLQGVFKLSFLQRRLARCLQDVIKTSSRCLEDALQDKTCCAKDVFKMSWRYVLKTYWRNALKTSWRPTNVSWVAVFLLQSRVFFNLFHSRDKRLLSDFMRKWGWFYGHGGSFPINLGSRVKFQKTGMRFCWWKSNNYSDINIFVWLEDPCILKLNVDCTKSCRKTIYAIQNDSKSDI